MPLVKLSPVFNSQVVDENGAPAVGWGVLAFEADSSTPLQTFTDHTGNIPQSQPALINALGFIDMGQLWIIAGRLYKLVLIDQFGAVKKTEDYIAGINDTSSSTDEWADSGVSPIYLSASSFSLPGDQTSNFHIGRRLKFQTIAGTVYGRITASIFTSLTTVTVQMDGAQVLDSGLSLVQVSILRNNVLSVPNRIAIATGTDTYVAAVGIQRLVIGDEYEIKVANANQTAAATLNLDATGALPLVNTAGFAMPPLTIFGEHKVRYNGTNFTVLNPVPPIPVKVRHCIQDGPTVGTPPISNLIPQSQIGNTIIAGVTVNPTAARVIYSVANGINADGSPCDLTALSNGSLPVPNLPAGTGATFTGSVTGTVLTVVSVASGTLAANQTLAGGTMVPGTVISSLGTGTGGPGTYNINIAQTVASSVMASNPSYSAIWVDPIAKSAGSVTVQDGDQNGGAIPVANNRLTFDYSTYINYLGNGTLAAQSNRLVVAEVYCSATAVVAIVCRAYLGRYVHPDTTPLPGTGAQVVFPHNIGGKVKPSSVVLKNITPQNSFLAGEESNGFVTVDSGPLSYSLGIRNSRNRGLVITGANVAFRALTTSGVAFDPTAASWSYSAIIERAY